MTLYFSVEKLSELKYQAFIPDPNDPLNTVDSGRKIQELMLEVIPEPMRGGKGMLVFQLNDPKDMQFKPGDRVKAELTVEA